MTKRYAKSTIEERSVARRMRCLMQEQARRGASNATAPVAASPPCSRLPPLLQKPASPRKPCRSDGGRESGGPGTTQGDEDHRRFRACRRSYTNHHGSGFM